MARKGESYGHRFLIALAGVLLSTGGILLHNPLLTISQKCPDKISIYLSVYALFLLNPLCFYLNILLLLLHVSAPEAPRPVLVRSHLPRAAHTIALTTLLLSAPLSIHVAAEEEHVGSAIGAALVCLALVTILTSVFKKFFISSFRASRGVIPALFALFISTGYLISFDSFLSFSEKDQYDALNHHIPINLLLSFVSFFVFILSITLLILWISAPSDGQQVSIRAGNLVIAALSVALATLLVSGYIKVYGVVTDMAVVVGVPFEL